MYENVDLSARKLLQDLYKKYTYEQVHEGLKFIPVENLIDLRNMIVNILTNKEWR